MDKSNEFFDYISEEDLSKLNVLSSQIQFLIAESFKHKNPSSPLAQKAAKLHKEWIELVYGEYDHNLHRELANKYSKEDKESKEEGEFFKQAIFIFIKEDTINNGSD